VLSWIVGLLVAGTIGAAALGGAAMSGAHIIGANGDRVSPDGNNARGKPAAMEWHVQQAGKELRTARKSGISDAQQGAMAG
jgi:hypothetical protein